MCRRLNLCMIDCRPLNRILVAQKITKPQAVVSFACTLMHLLINWLFVDVFGGGPSAVAWANSLANLNMLLGMLAYVLLYNKGYCVWGKGVSLQAFKVSRSKDFRFCGQRTTHVPN